MSKERDFEKNNDSDTDNDVFDYTDVDSMEKMNFDFEAFPPDPSDIDGIINLITQIFLRVNLDCKAVAEEIVKISPIGCVFKPAEECEDDEMGSLVYGVVSVIDFLKNEKSINEIKDFLYEKANKYASKMFVNLFKELLTQNDSKKNRVGFLINERMIHFPTAISGPAFKSVKNDINSTSKQDMFDYFLFIIKIRVSDSNTTSQQSIDASAENSNKSRKRKLSKAKKKELIEQKIAASNLIYDNEEEALLFKPNDSINYFQYPVQSDVEKNSKFHGTIINGVIYRPYRRVCLLTKKQFNDFADNVIKTFSLT